MSQSGASQTLPTATLPPPPTTLPPATLAPAAFTPPLVTVPPAPALTAPPSRPNDLIPDDEEVFLLAGNILANKVASPQTVAAVLAALRRSHTSATAADLVALAWACYHNGSSRYTALSGTSPHGVPLAELKDQVEEHCTLRQFCMYYAKVCYNTGRTLKKPPANWMGKGFKEDTKYAAFDFFAGVHNDAAPKPRGGMRFQPTAAEIAAHAVNATMTILESREPAHQVSNRGNMLAMQQVRAPPATPMITFE